MSCVTSWCSRSSGRTRRSRTATGVLRPLRQAQGRRAQDVVRWPNRAMGEREQGLRVSVSDERGRPLRATGLALWLRRVAPRRARGAVSIALVSDRRIRSLNRTYRRRDYATDVLSFPSKERDFLGDIAIAKGVAARQ